MKINRKQLITGFLVIVGMILVFVLAYQVVPKVMVMWSKAAPATKVSTTDSYILGEKILARANGEDTVKVNVFLMDKDGKPVTGESAELTGVDDIKYINQLSDMTGKVSFEIKSAVSKQYKIKALYKGNQIGKELVITFRSEE